MRFWIGRLRTTASGTHITLTFRDRTHRGSPGELAIRRRSAEDGRERTRRGRVTADVQMIRTHYLRTVSSFM